MIKRLYELVTGNPWITSRSLTDDGILTLGAQYADEWATLTDSELMSMTTTEAIAWAEGRRVRRNAGVTTGRASAGLAAAAARW
ncbi:MAG: hypothetical protein HOV83_07185 [Catenulispora sp.]|nr:hypothetical protein [Catenulispora sp.]